MNPPASPQNSETNPQKARKGLSRVLHAGGYSLQGLKAGWGETAFRQECLAAFVLVPLAQVAPQRVTPEQLAAVATQPLVRWDGD